MSAARQSQTPPAHGSVEYPNAEAPFRIVQLWAKCEKNGADWREPSTFRAEWCDAAGNWHPLPVIHRHEELDSP